MAIGNIVRIKAARKDFDLHGLAILYGIKGHNCTIDDRLTNGFIDPLNAICKRKTGCGAVLNT